MKEKLKITRNDFRCFYEFAEDNGLKFVEDISAAIRLYHKSIYFSDRAGTYLSWDERTTIKELKIIIKMINPLITNYDLYLGK